MDSHRLDQVSQAERGDPAAPSIQTDRPHPERPRRQEFAFASLANACGTVLAAIVVYLHGVAVGAIQANARVLVPLGLLGLTVGAAIACGALWLRAARIENPILNGLSRAAIGVLFVVSWTVLSLSSNRPWQAIGLKGNPIGGLQTIAALIVQLVVIVALIRRRFLRHS